jgi:hypothetical protein
MNLDDNYLDFEEPTPEKGKDNTKILIAVAVGVVLCCCCAFVLSGWFWWGDLLVEALGGI